MNLALLDPFRRQYPDRIDSTLALPRELHSCLPHLQARTEKETKLESDSSKNQLASCDGSSETSSHGKGVVDDNISMTSSVDDLSTSRSRKISNKKNTVNSIKSGTGNKAETHKKEKKNKSCGNIIPCVRTAFNRRGTYLAAGYGCGTVAIWDYLSRTLIALYPPIELEFSQFQANVDCCSSSEEKAGRTVIGTSNNRSVTNLCWSTNGRALLITYNGDNLVRRVDVSAPNPDFFIWNSSAKLVRNERTGSERVERVQYFNVDDDDAIKLSRETDTRRSGSNGTNSNYGPGKTLLLSVESLSHQGNHVSMEYSPSTKKCISQKQKRKWGVKGSFSNSPHDDFVSSHVLPLPLPVANVAGGCQFHPRDDNAGLAVLNDGSLVLFHFQKSLVECRRQITSCRVVYIVSPGGSNHLEITDPQRIVSAQRDFGCEVEVQGIDSYDSVASYRISSASFSPRGEYIYAVTSTGWLLCFNVASLRMRHDDADLDKTSTKYFVKCIFRCATRSVEENIPSIQAFPASMSDDNRKSIDRTSYSNDQLCLGSPNAFTYTVACSRHGSLVLVSSLLGGVLQLYDAKKLHQEMELSDSNVRKRGKDGVVLKKVAPRHIFADLVNPNQTVFYGTDFSGDGEYLAGGCNSAIQGDRYELYIWNTNTGELLDRLMGPQGALLFDTSWHPTRAFIAVASNDGLLDLWGPKVDWTAFAPDFQALPMNVEYVEKEDEFDTVVGESKSDEILERNLSLAKEEVERKVDVVSIERLPVFESDSEEESMIFSLRTAVKPLVSH